MTGAVREWLSRAQEDLKTVEKLLDDAGLTNIAAFHAQQCIEKCLKAMIETTGNPVPRIHDLVRLVALTTEIQQIPIDEITLIELSTIYLDSRYPATTGFLPTGKPDLEDVKRFHHTAAAIFRFAASFGDM